MPPSAQLGSQLRGMRAAAGRTVASVAADAGLSVPYIANLENGRGNPTLAALDRLATALGTSVQVSFAPAGEPAEAVPAREGMPASLVRLGRSRRFRRDAELIARAAGSDPGELSVQLISALAGLAGTLGSDPGEAGWHRLLDALLLIALYPSPPS
jgi:transcriptional regulator with XRE-family HTH domain